MALLSAAGEHELAWSMTEKEKMLAGALYRGTDPHLVREQVRGQQRVERYNASDPADRAGRRALLGELLGAVGENVTIRPRFACDYGTNIRIGRGTFINFDCVFLDCALIEIGEDVQMAPGVHLYTAQHPIEPIARRDGLEYALPIRIEDNVWLGGRVVVCPGVTIGRDTVVGAGSVVVRDLPAGVVAAGSPARVIRQVTSEPPHRAR
jgi:maltose O-acetyltransferase